MYVVYYRRAVRVGAFPANRRWKSFITTLSSCSCIIIIIIVVIIGGGGGGGISCGFGCWGAVA
jgi:hypothetical protein